MHTEDLLRQVELSRQGNLGMKQLVVWIDNRLAVLNARVRDEDGHVWLVTALYGKKPFADLESHRAAWKRWAEVLGQ